MRNSRDHIPGSRVELNEAGLLVFVKLNAEKVVFLFSITSRVRVRLLVVIRILFFRSRLTLSQD